MVLNRRNDSATTRARPREPGVSAVLLAGAVLRGALLGALVWMLLSRPQNLLYLSLSVCGYLTGRYLGHLFRR